MSYRRYFNNFIRVATFSTKTVSEGKPIQILGVNYPPDDYTNVTGKILSYVGKNLHNNNSHPLCLTKKKMVQYFYSQFKNNTGNPLFSVYDNLNPVVTVEDNFDSLLIPKEHVSRNKSECYYINRKNLLRAHMTAHQTALIKAGLDNFIFFGDVYRRDTIDSTHFPVFHQSDAVNLFNKFQLETIARSEISIFDNRDLKNTKEKQSIHTLEATKITENHLKNTLVGLVKVLYGKDICCRWVDVYFPFTHPSWELEIQWDGKWIELLGCGIIRHEILEQAGVRDRIGWAFGIGLERIAMRLYNIPDIRLFWSNDSGFLSQFKNKSPFDKIKYKPISIYPQCTNDLSFWLPEDNYLDDKDFFELVRDVGGDIVEQVDQIDEFTHPKTSRKSRTYRMVYRHLERTLTQEEVNRVHKLIGLQATNVFGITVR